VAASASNSTSSPPPVLWSPAAGPEDPCASGAPRSPPFQLKLRECLASGAIGTGDGSPAIQAGEDGSPAIQGGEESLRLASVASGTGESSPLLESSPILDSSPPLLGSALTAHAEGKDCASPDAGARTLRST
jgi:hypothetical protein